MTIEQYISQNKKRIEANNKSYNPLTGEGATSCERKKVRIGDAPIPDMWLPKKMLEDEFVRSLVSSGSLKGFAFSLGESTEQSVLDMLWVQFTKIRIRYDFEFWAYSFCVIKEKGTERDIPFLLNRGQRKLLSYFYHDIHNDKPIRIILLKARQWGGSTLTQIFMIWIQLVLKKQWNSVICSHVENTAKVIRGMYTKVLKNYPAELIADGLQEVKLMPFENSQKTRQIAERQCRITIGSAERPDGIRGDDISMAHLSEVGLWKKTQGKSAEDLVQAIISGIASVPYSMIVYESTAKGVGNFFHNEWLRAKELGKKSAFTPVFVSWFEIDNYTKQIDDYKQFIESMNDAEKNLFVNGATLEAINWYRDKNQEYKDEWRFKTEFPSFDYEAFQSTGNRYYNIMDVHRLRENCCNPDFVGDIEAEDRYGADALNGIKFVPKEHGELNVWQMPHEYSADENRISDRYIVVVDIGGTSQLADRSVICVFDRFWMKDCGMPEVVAEWCGHTEHYLLAWKAVQLAKSYDNALLVIESNTLETEHTEGNNFVYVLDEIHEYYDNLYCRTSPDQIRQGVPPRWGFHTNKSSKNEVCSHMRKALRENLYIERCNEAVDEFDTFEIKENGELGAVEGCHDDRHITRAIGVYICYKLPAPKEMQRNDSLSHFEVISEASL